MDVDAMILMIEANGMIMILILVGVLNVMVTMRVETLGVQ